MTSRAVRFAIGLACCLPVARASADFTLDIGSLFKGTAPSGTPPWLRASFHDAAGGVELTLQSLLHGPTEFVDFWLFNLNPAFDPSHLAFTPLSGGPLPWRILASADHFRGDDAGRFDIKFDWYNGPASRRFDGSDAVVYRITSSDPIHANSFNVLSDHPGDHGPYPSAALIRGIATCDEDDPHHDCDDDDHDGHGWVSVPEPAGLIPLTLGLILIMRSRRRA